MFATVHPNSIDLNVENFFQTLTTNKKYEKRKHRVNEHVNNRQPTMRPVMKMDFQVQTQPVGAGIISN